MGHFYGLLLALVSETGQAPGPQEHFFMMPSQAARSYGTMDSHAFILVAPNRFCKTQPRTRFRSLYHVHRCKRQHGAWLGMSFPSHDLGVSVFRAIGPLAASLLETRQTVITHPERRQPWHSRRCVDLQDARPARFIPRVAHTPVSGGDQNPCARRHCQ